LAVGNLPNLAGDVTGAITSNTVVAIQGNAVEAVDYSATQDGYVLTWVNSADMWEAKPATGSGGGITALTGDVTASGTGSVAASVISITGGSGVVNVAATGNIITWAAATTAPGLRQADLSTNSGAGAALTIQAQNETGTTSTGGNLVLKSGTGTTVGGNILLDVGSTVVYTISNPGGTTSGTSLTSNSADTKLLVNSYTADVATTTTGNVTMFSYTIASNKVINVDVIVVANANASAATTAAAVFKLNAIYKNIGGTVTAIGTTPVVISSQADASLSTATAVISNSTVTISVVVAGVAATTITWTAYVQISIGSI
jgi:hypothetical protein